MNQLLKAVRGMMPQKQEANSARGTVSGWAPGVSSLWGQPYPEQMAQDATATISRQHMREIVMRTPTAAASVNAILDFAGGVKLDIRNVDPSKQVGTKQANMVKRLMRRPNSDQTKRQFLLTLMRDIVTFGFGGVEFVPTGEPNYPVEMWVMDGARLRIDFNEHGYIKGYDMLNARGAPIISDESKDTNSIYEFPNKMNMGALGGTTTKTGGELHGWEPDEVMFFSLNPISESVYPHSRIVQLYTAAVLEDLMMQFVANRFTDSNIPFGVFDLGDVTETELKLAIDNWNSQGDTGNRIIMTGSKGAGSKYIPFGYHLKDLEATALLSEIRMKIMGILGVTMQELGESQDINRSNGYNLSFTFKKRAIEPLLHEVTETLTKRLLWDVLGYTDLEFYFEEIDSRDDFLMSQIDTNYEKLGLLTPNEIRNRMGLTSVKGGDDNYIFTGSSWVPIDMLREMSAQLIAVEAASTGVALSGPEGSENIRVHSNAPAPAHDIAPSAQDSHKGASSEIARNLGANQ